MVATERTSLTRPTDPPAYVEFAGILINRRNKIRQFQCCVCASMLAVFVMLMVVMVSYYVNDADSLVADTTNPETVPPPPPLKSVWMKDESNLQIPNEMSPTSLTTMEWDEAVKIGQEAINLRLKADELSTPLPAPSPNSRHQYAVKTSLQAGKLALGGIGELAATRYVEKTRLMLGGPSSIGSYFKNIWVPTDTCKEFFTATCPLSKYRNFDGTCNHPRNFGAALTPFIRKLPADYSDNVDLPRIGKYGKSLPSAREISLKVHPPAPSSNPNFTVMLAVFGQFLDHDITATAISQGNNGSSLSCCPAETQKHSECFPVEVGPGDPVFDIAGRNCMEFVRSAPAPQCKIGPREQLNQVTAFIDGSVIYGPDRQTADSLRHGQGGLLRMFITPDNRTLLPRSTDPNDGCNRIAESARGRYCFASGDGRANENLHLTTMHLLWARQHNKLATALSKVNPTWSDETIYQETRRIIGAQLQHITYNEFIPIVLGETEVNLRKLKPLSSGFRSKNDSARANPAIANSFAAAAFRFAHTLLPGLMKVTDSQKTTSTYVELHRMLFNPYSLYSKGGMETSLTTATSNTIQKTTTHVTSQLTNHLFEDPLANKTIPCGLDLVSLNIQRGRDHGLPGYTAWRRHCGLGTIQTFDELRGDMDPDALDEISKLYAHVDDIDLYTGALAEINYADGLVGPTFTCIIGDQFSRIQQGDRFWYELPGEPQSFTEGQLREIRKTTLAKLICDCSDEINQIQHEVMRSISPQNPMISCEDIPGINLSAWKDGTSSPILTDTAAVGTPETWLNFETEINNTVKEIVDFFGKTVPVSGSADWTKFGDWINKSFADLRNNISALYPKTVQQISLHLGSKNDFSKSSEEITKGKQKLNDLDFDSVRSFPESTEYLTAPMIQSTTYDDWVNFKKGIKQVLNNALANVTGIPSPEQRDELMKRITTEIAEIRKSIMSMKGTEPHLSENQTATNEGTANLNWLNLKNDILKATIEAIDRIQKNAPASGDPAWATFGKNIKTQFDSIKYQIPISPEEKVAQKLGQNPSSVLHESILETSSAVKKDKYSFKNNPLTESKAEHFSNMIFWDNFGNTLNKSITSTVASVAGKNLKPDDPAWIAMRKNIMNGALALQDNFSVTKKNQGLQSAESIKDPKIAKYWDDFRNSLNKSINNALAEIPAKSPAPGDPAWAAFAAKIMNNFSTFKDNFPKSPVKAGNFKEKASKNEKNVPFDWYSFKMDIIKSVTDTTSYIQKNMPPPDSPDWPAFRTQIMDGFAKIPDDGAIKILPNSKIVQKELSPSKSQIFDWIAFKNELNQSLSNIMAKNYISMNLLPEDSKWKNFKTKPDNSKEMLQATKTKIDPNVKKLEELQFSFLMKDWVDFKEKINKSLEDAIDSIKSKSPSPGDPAWATFRDSIKNQFATLKNEIDISKPKVSSTVHGVSERPLVSLSDGRAEPTSIRPELSRDPFPLQEKSDKTESEKITVGAGITQLIPAADWIAFKQEINVTIANFVKALSSADDAVEWKKMKGSIENSFAELRNEIISLRNNTILSP